jgi:hypothetical protein
MEWKPAGKVDIVHKRRKGRRPMLARVSTIKMPPDGIDASIAHFEQVALPPARELAGFKGATLLVSRDKGTAKLLTYWSSRDDLAGSAESATRLRTGWVDAVEGAELVSVEIFEVAVDVV